MKDQFLVNQKKEDLDNLLEHHPKILINNFNKIISIKNLMNKINFK